MYNVSFFFQITFSNPKKTWDWGFEEKIRFVVVVQNDRTCSKWSVEAMVRGDLKVDAVNKRGYMLWAYDLSLDSWVHLCSLGIPAMDGLETMKSENAFWRLTTCGKTWTPFNTTLMRT
jgi:hypothetical protein